MKKFWLVDSIFSDLYEYTRSRVIVPAEEVKEFVNATFLEEITGHSATTSDEINSFVEELADRHNQEKPRDTYRWLQELGYDMEHLKNYVNATDMVVYDTINGDFGNLMDYPTEMTYEYFDIGCNSQYIVVSDCAELVTVSDQYVNLDEWDGDNFSTIGRFMHQRVYRVYERGELADGTYLIYHWTNWQGDLPIGFLLSELELRKYLKQIKRNPDEYMPHILALPLMTPEEAVELINSLYAMQKQRGLNDIEKRRRAEAWNVLEDSSICYEAYLNCCFLGRGEDEEAAFAAAQEACKEDLDKEDLDFLLILKEEGVAE